MKFFFERRRSRAGPNSGLSTQSLLLAGESTSHSIQNTSNAKGTPDVTMMRTVIQRR